MRWLTENFNKAVKEGSAWPGLPVAVGLSILLISLIHIPSVWDALNHFDPLKRVCWAFLALVLAGRWRARGNRLGRRPLALSLGLLAWIVIRTLLKPQPTVELDILFTWILPVLLFILAGCLVPTRGLRMFFGCLVLAAVLQAGLMVLQRCGLDPLFSNTTSVMAYKPGRMVGTIGYQNQAVDFLALSGVGILLVSRSVLLRLSLMVGLLFVAALTGNRGGIVAFASALGISQVVWFLSHVCCGIRNSSQQDFRRLAGVAPSMLPPPPIAAPLEGDRSREPHQQGVLSGAWKKWRVAAAAVLAGCGLLGAAALIPETRGRFHELITDYRHSPAVGSRTLMARVAVDLWRDRPWTGWGAGEYAYQYLDRLGALLPEKKTHEALQNIVFAREAHNDYLQFAAEFGMVGVLLVAGLVVVALVRLGRARNSDEASASYGAPSLVKAAALPGEHSRGCDAAAVRTTARKTEGGCRGLETPFAMLFVLVYMAVSSLSSFPWQTSMGGPLAGFLLGLLWPAGGAEGPGALGAASARLLNILARAVKTALVVVSLILVGWFAVDAFLNTDIPLALELGGPASAARLLPRSVYRYHALVGAEYAAQGAYDEAEKELLAAEAGYRDVPLWNNLGHVQAKLHKWDAAREVYARWDRCGLDHSNALLDLSIACEKTRRFREAADALIRRNALWGKPPAAEIKRLAVLQLQAGDAQGAQDTLRRHQRTWAAADARAVAEFENLAGSACLVLGDAKNAEKWFRSALERNPNLESARRNLAGLAGGFPKGEGTKGEGPSLRPD